MRKPMHRRNILAAAFAATGALFATGARPARAQTRDAGKVAYHLSDLDKVGFVLGNIEHHLAGAGGPDTVTIALVIHGPPLRAFHIAGAGAGADPGTARRVAALVKDGVKLNACIHTMRGQNVTLKDLLPGFAVAERGGVVLLAELQAQGYVYLRP
jgi:intracellular sulfur oxidation DsrE/DsrF family protein